MPAPLSLTPVRPHRPVREWLAIAAIAAAVILTQFGALTREVIDHDETTFILMGTDVAAGHLPFVQLFDLKPPVIFLLLGSVVAIFGKSLFAVRLLGDLFLFATALLTYGIGRRFASPPAALGGTLIYVSIVSLDFGQWTSTELPATAFLMGALWLLLRTPVGLPVASAAGVLVSLAVLTRTNLGIVALAVGILLLWAGWRSRGTVAPRAWLAYGFAGLLSPTALILIYAWAGELATLKLAMLDVPLAYSSQLTFWQTLVAQAELLFDQTRQAPAILAPAGGLAIGGLLILGHRIAHRPSFFSGWNTILPLGFAASVALSILASGAAYTHYWLQILPFLCLLATVALDRALSSHRALALATLLLFGLPLGDALAAKTPATIALATGAEYDLDYDMAAAAEHIAATGPAHPRVWCWSKHLVHWHLDAPLLSPAATHPDNLGRRSIISTLSAHGYVSSDEIGRIMFSRPDYVVTDAGDVGLAWIRKTGKPVDQWLAANYYLERYFGDVLVYRRLD